MKVFLDANVILDYLTLHKTDWLMTLAPPELDPAIFERPLSVKKRQRARAVRRPHEELLVSAL